MIIQLCVLPRSWSRCVLPCAWSQIQLANTVQLFSYICSQFMLSMIFIFCTALTYMKCLFNLQLQLSTLYSYFCVGQFGSIMPHQIQQLTIAIGNRLINYSCIIKHACQSIKYNHNAGILMYSYSHNCTVIRHNYNFWPWDEEYL